MSPDEPNETTRARADEAQSAAEAQEADKPARQWREEAERIAAVQADQVERAAAMGDRVEESIPAPDPQDDPDPGVTQERDRGEARGAMTGKSDPQHR